MTTKNHLVQVTGFTDFIWRKSADCENLNIIRYLKFTAAAPRHLKKAWLQRHTTGEDSEQSSIAPTQTANTTIAVIEPTNTSNKAGCPDSDHSGRDSMKSTSAYSVNISSSPPNNSNRRTGNSAPNCKTHHLKTY